MNYYNEFDRSSAAWLRELIAARLIPEGKVDERSIVEVKPVDLVGFVQCHFFCGITGWPYALGLAGWNASRSVWTASLPCQPFSQAGKRRGEADERHLWPVFYELVRECRPPIIFGEQVASSKVVGHKGERLGVPAHLSPSASSQGPNTAREEEGGGQGTPFRSGSKRGANTGTHQSGSLRSYGSTSQSGWRAHLGQSLAGQNCPFCGLPIREHSDCLPCGEQCDGRLGRTEDGGHGSSHLGEAQREVERLVYEIGRSLAAQTEWVWLDGVQLDLEHIGYTFGASVLPACGVGAPHIRQRLYWVANAVRTGRTKGRAIARGRQITSSGSVGGLGVADGTGSQPGRQAAASAGYGRAAEPAGNTGRLADFGQPRLEERGSDGRIQRAALGRDKGQAVVSGGDSGGLDNGFSNGRESSGNNHRSNERFIPSTDGPWSDFDLIPCADGKARRVERGTFPLVNGFPRGVVPSGDPSIQEAQATAEARVMRLKGYGNAIVPSQAAEFIGACAEVLEEFGC